MIEFKRIRANKIPIVVALLGVLVFVACAGPRGWPGPIIAGDTLYVGSTEGKVLALNPTNGSEIWTWEPQKQQSGGFLSCASAGQFSAGKMYGAPAVANGLVYIGAYDGKVYAIEADTGVGRWTQDIDSPIVGGVAVAGNTVFAGSSEGKLYALDAEAGFLLWKFPREGEIGKVWTTPTVDEGVVYFGSLDHKLYALDAASGELIWNKPFEADGAIAAPPLVVGGVVYVGSFDSKLYAIYAGNGEQKWVFDQAKNWFWAKALYYEGTIYVGSLDNNVYALDAESGSQVWSEPVRTGGPVRSAPVIAGGVLVVASEDGRVYWLNPDTGAAKWVPLDLEVKVPSALSAAGNMVYLSTEDNMVYVLDTEKGRPSIPPIPLGK